MSLYTNDIDTLRQMISQTLPQLLMTIIVVVTCWLHDAVLSVWLCWSSLRRRRFMPL